MNAQRQFLGDTYEDTPKTRKATRVLNNISINVIYYGCLMIK
jgi:hypothetical protein